MTADALDDLGSVIEELDAIHDGLTDGLADANRQSLADRLNAVTTRLVALRGDLQVLTQELASPVDDWEPREGNE